MPKIWDFAILENFINDKININLILELLKSIPVPCKGLYAFFKSLVILGVFGLRIRFSFDSTDDKLIEDDPS